VFIVDEEAARWRATGCPDEAAISVVTLAELEHGVPMGGSEAVRGVLLRTLQAPTYVALPVDAAVASAFAEPVATARQAGRRPKLQDAWIAATARAVGVPVYTQDTDFDDLSVDVVRV
jgi:predicted nucleic acid-binding protein